MFLDKFLSITARSPDLAAKEQQEEKELKFKTAKRLAKLVPKGSTNHTVQNQTLMRRSHSTVLVENDYLTMLWNILIVQYTL